MTLIIIPSHSMTTVVWFTLRDASCCVSTDLHLHGSSAAGNNARCGKDTSAMSVTGPKLATKSITLCLWLSSLIATDGDHCHQPTHNARNSAPSFSKTLGVRAALQLVLLFDVM